jgi:hypothetical protein
MSIGNLSKNDILEALGIDTGGWIGPAAAAFGIGLAVGAAAALMLAPKSGAELREDIADRVGKMRQNVQSGNVGANTQRPTV